MRKQLKHDINVWNDYTDTWLKMIKMKKITICLAVSSGPINFPLCLIGKTDGNSILRKLYNTLYYNRLKEIYRITLKIQEKKSEGNAF